jgi:exosortase
VLAIPPPERLYRAVTQPLQQAASAAATFVLNTFPGAEVERDGINIFFWMQGGETGQFTVAGACSGMRSLMAFVALGLAMAYFTPRPLWHRLLMAAAVIPVALFCNVVRVIATGSFQMYGLPDLASGSPHTFLGLMTFALGFGLYFAILWVLDHMFVESREEAVAA